MYEVLKDEQTEDDKTDVWCVADLDKASAEAKETEVDIGELGASVDEARDAIAATTSEIEALKAGLAELDKNVAEARDFYKKSESRDGVINMIDDEQKFKDKEDMYKQKRQNIREAQGTIAYNRDERKAGRDGVRAA